jgi:C-terminal processing protease CtpA/Prc
MLRRLSLIITIIVAVGASIAIAGSAGQKDKTDKADSKAKIELVDKLQEKAEVDAQAGVFAIDLGEDTSYLGAYLEEVTPERTKELGLTEERGAIVMKLVTGSPAEKSGLKENDVIVSFNGRRVDSVRELQRLLTETPPARTVQMEVIRGGSHQTLTAILTKRSAQSFKLLGPGFDQKNWKLSEDAMKRAEEAVKRSGESMKHYQEKMKELPNFGDFAFVNPGEFAYFGGTRLGISAESLTDQLSQFFGVKDGKGVLVASVKENSSAAKAGIKAGDVIVAIDDQKVDSVGALVKTLAQKTEGTVAVKLVRNHAEQTVNVTLEKHEPAPPRRRAVAYTRQSAVV